MKYDDIAIAASYVPSRFCVYRDINVGQETIDLIAVGSDMLVMIDVRLDVGRIRAHGRYGGGTVLSLNRKPFPEGDPLKKSTHNLFALKEFIYRTAGINASILPAICFPAKPPSFVDLPYTESLTSLKIHVMKRTCLGPYLEYQEKRLLKSRRMSDNSVKAVAAVLGVPFDN